MRSETGRAVRALLVAVVFVGLLQAGSPVDARSKCPSGYVCVYADAYYKGQVVKLHGSGFSNKLGDIMDNQASSIRNKSGSRALFYTDVNNGGTEFCVPPHNSIWDLTVASYNDVASSSFLIHDFDTC